MALRGRRGHRWQLARSGCANLRALAAVSASQPIVERAPPAHPRPVRQLVAEPGELPLGVVPRIALGLLAPPRRASSRRADAGSATARHAPSSPAASGRARARRAPAPPRARRRQHRVEARVDARVQLVAVGGEEDLDRRADRSSGGCLRACQSDERPAGRLEDLERPQDARRGRSAAARAAVAGRARASSAMQRRRRPPLPCARAPRCADVVGHRRDADSPSVSALK